MIVAKQVEGAVMALTKSVEWVVVLVLLGFVPTIHHSAADEATAPFRATNRGCDNAAVDRRKSDPYRRTWYAHRR
jgi:hypothetical protein